MGTIVSIVFGFIELVVGLRFFFRLLGADPGNIIVAWVYNISTPLVAPFAGIFGQSLSTAAGTVVTGVFEISTLVALVVYAIIAGIILQLFGRHTSV
jgi:hypothetical protein